MSNRDTHNIVLVATLMVAVFFMIPQDAIAQSFGGSGGFSNDPFEKGKTWLTNMGNGVSLIVTGGAFLGGMIVIAMAMAGKLKADWAGKIVGGLVAMTGLTWIIESIMNK